MNKTTILYVLITVVVAYAMIRYLVPKQQMPADYKATIDSLKKANIELQQKQESLDSSIKSYQTEISELDFRIDNIKERVTIVKEYHHEISKQVQTYNTQQTDSFLRSRYNY